MLIQEIIDRANKIPLEEIRPPNEPVSEGENVIGVLPDNLKPLFVLMQKEFENLIRLEEEIKNFARSKTFSLKGAIEKISFEFGRAKYFCEVLRFVFWRSVQYEFPRTWGNTIGIRIDWKIVVLEDWAAVIKDLTYEIQKFFDRGS